MKITRIVNGQEMEFELTDSELRAALVNTLFSPEKCLDTNLPHPLPIVLWEQQRDTLFLLLPHFF